MANITKILTPCHFGIYRAIVVDTDGFKLAVAVPELSGNQALGWALPCVMPWVDMSVIGSDSHGDSHGFTTTPPKPTIDVPPRGAAVWVMFEHGDAMYPVWLGILAGG